MQPVVTLCLRQFANYPRKLKRGMWKARKNCHLAFCTWSTHLSYVVPELDWQSLFSSRRYPCQECKNVKIFPKGSKLRKVQESNWSTEMYIANEHGPTYGDSGFCFDLVQLMPWLITLIRPSNTFTMSDEHYFWVLIWTCLRSPIPVTLPALGFSSQVPFCNLPTVAVSNSASRCATSTPESSSPPEKYAKTTPSLPSPYFDWIQLESEFWI